MKMGNIFGNGVFVDGSTIYTLRDSQRGQVNDYFAHFQNVKASDEECAIVARHVKHAIESHDGLVDAVEILLLHPELANRQAISELLAQVKGE